MKFAILSIGLVAGLISCSPAIAQQGDYSLCHPASDMFERAALVGQLSADYGELPVVALLEQPAQPGDDIGVIELFINPMTGSWSLISTNTDLMSCFVQAGHQSFLFAPEVVAEGDPA